jgi:hypothetical protein
VEARNTEGDGKINLWNMLPPEEATAEAIAALANCVPSRFASVLLSSREQEALGLGAEKARQTCARVGNVERSYKATAPQTTSIAPEHS